LDVVITIFLQIYIYLHFQTCILTHWGFSMTIDSIKIVKFGITFFKKNRINHFHVTFFYKELRLNFWFKIEFAWGFVDYEYL